MHMYVPLRTGSVINFLSCPSRFRNIHQETRNLVVWCNLFLIGEAVIALFNRRPPRA